jgi:hypothetical protein
MMGEKTALGIANSFWFNKTFRPARPFLQRNADFFGAVRFLRPSAGRELVFDRPFLYGILGLETGLPLFTGVMGGSDEIDGFRGRRCGTGT